MLSEWICSGIFLGRDGTRWDGSLRYRDGAGAKCAFAAAGDIRFISGMGLSVGSGFQVGAG
jgi:hypothetical protein